MPRLAKRGLPVIDLDSDIESLGPGEPMMEDDAPLSPGPTRTPESETEPVAFPVSPQSSHMVCTVRGCSLRFSAHSKFLAHLFINHPKARLTEELRDLGWSAGQPSKSPAALKELCGLSNIGNTLRRLLRSNVRFARIPLPRGVVSDIRLTVDPSFGVSLGKFGELKEDGVDPATRVNRVSSIDDYLALIAFEAEEATVMSRRRLLRHLALLRDVLLQLNGNRQYGHTWTSVAADFETVVTDAVVESVANDVRMSQRMMLAKPATKVAVCRAAIAVKRFVVKFANNKIHKSGPHNN